MSEPMVDVVRGVDINRSFQELLGITDFDHVLESAQVASGKSKQDFRVVIKPNRWCMWPTVDTKPPSRI